MTEFVQGVRMDPEVHQQVFAAARPYFDDVVTRRIVERLSPDARVSMVGDWMPGKGYTILINDDPVAHCRQAVDAYDAVKVVQDLAAILRDAEKLSR